MKIYVGIIIAVLLNAMQIQAKSNTCVEQIQRAVTSTVMITAVPVSGWLVGAMFAPMLSALNKDKLRLKSASIIKNGMYNSQVLDKAHRRIEMFYQILIQKYPDMTLSKNEVIDVLHDFNVNSVKNRKCMEYAGSIMTELFPDKNAHAYLAFIKSHEDAAKVRAEKNSADGVRYYGEI